MVSLGTRVFTDFGSKVIKVKRITDSDDCWEQSVCHHQDVRITPLDAVPCWVQEDRHQETDWSPQQITRYTMFCIHIKKTLSSGISLGYLTTPLIALHNIGWEKKFYFIVTEMSSWQLSKKKMQLNKQEKPQNI